MRRMVWLGLAILALSAASDIPNAPSSSLTPESAATERGGPFHVAVPVDEKPRDEAVITPSTDGPQANVAPAEPVASADPVETKAEPASPHQAEAVDAAKPVPHEPAVAEQAEAKTTPTQVVVDKTLDREPVLAAPASGEQPAVADEEGTAVVKAASEDIKTGPAEPVAAEETAEEKAVDVAEAGPAHTPESHSEAPIIVTPDHELAAPSTGSEDEFGHFDDMYDNVDVPGIWEVDPYYKDHDHMPAKAFSGLQTDSATDGADSGDQETPASELSVAQFMSDKLPPQPYLANGRGPVVVSFSLRILQILEVEEKSQSFGILGELAMSWREPRLQTPENIRAVNLDPTSLWTPKVYAVNMVKQNVVSEHVQLYKHSDTVHKIHVKRRFTATFFTDLNFSWFPYDQHTLPIEFVIYGRSENKVRWALYPDVPLTGRLAQTYQGSWSCMVSRKANHPAWQIEGTSVRTIYPSATGQPTVLVKVNIDRRVYSYFMKMLLPILALSGSSYLSYWIDPAAVPARMALCITTVLCTLVFSITINRDLPMVGYATWLDFFNIGNFLIVFTALIVFAMVHYFRREERKHRDAMDKQPLLGGKQPIIWSEKIDKDARFIVPILWGVMIMALFIPAWIAEGSSQDSEDVLPEVN